MADGGDKVIWRTSNGVISISLPVSDRQIGRQTDSNHYCLWSKQAHTHTILITLSVYTLTDKTGEDGAREEETEQSERDEQRLKKTKGF